MNNNNKTVEMMISLVLIFFCIALTEHIQGSPPGEGVGQIERLGQDDEEFQNWLNERREYGNYEEEEGEETFLHEQEEEEILEEQPLLRRFLTKSAAKASEALTMLKRASCKPGVKRGLAICTIAFLAPALMYKFFLVPSEPVGTKLSAIPQHQNHHFAPLSPVIHPPGQKPFNKLKTECGKKMLLGGKKVCRAKLQVLADGSYQVVGEDERGERSPVVKVVPSEGNCELVDGERVCQNTFSLLNPENGQGIDVRFESRKKISSFSSPSKKGKEEEEEKEKEEEEWRKKMMKKLEGKVKKNNGTAADNNKSRHVQFKMGE